MTPKNISVSMRRESLENIPQFELELEEPYRIRFYEPGDEQAWTDIHVAADRFNSIDPGLFRREFGYDEERLSARQLYIVDGTGTAVGTASAWSYENGTGQVHWVAIHPSHQGKGLAKPLMTQVCNTLRRLGHRSAELGTSSGRIAALGLYLVFGFRPLIKEDSQREGWRDAARHIGHHGLDELRT